MTLGIAGKFSPAACVCRELEALAGSKQNCNRPVGQSDIEHPPCKVARTSRQVKPASSRHVETEQRRRDRIIEGCAKHYLHMCGDTVRTCFGASPLGP